MRSRTRGLSDVLAQLQKAEPRGPESETYRSLCQVEIGLRLQERVLPGDSAAQAWVLFSGYPFAAAWRAPLPRGSEQLLRAGRYSMWELCERQKWLEALERYQRFSADLRGFDVHDLDRPAQRRELFVAAARWDSYDELLRVAPPLVEGRQRVARPGPHVFPVGRGTSVVNLPSVPRVPFPVHAVNELPPGEGEPLTLSLEQLKKTAGHMDEIRNCGWRDRVESFCLLVRAERGFEESRSFTIDGIQHLLGIAGADVGALRDVIVVHLASGSAKKRTTVVVGDFSEVLELVKTYNIYTNGAAAPVMDGHSGERHAQCLHRRQADRGEHRLLAHHDQSFDYLGTSCVLNVLCEEPGKVGTAFGESRCTQLQSQSPQEREIASAGQTARGRRMYVCPYWGMCPRHHSSRALVEADIWVSTPAALMNTSPPKAQNREWIQYLELACRRSDLIILDEADRVQMQWDRAFAPIVPLAGGDGGGFIEELVWHTKRELVSENRMQLSDRDVESFVAAVNTAQGVIDRLYSMLVGDHALRSCMRNDYFSARTLQRSLLEERYSNHENEANIDQGGVGEGEFDKEQNILRRRLEAFREDPFGDRFRSSEEGFGALTSLLNEILHTGNRKKTRRRVVEAALSIFQLDSFIERKQKEFESMREGDRSESVVWRKRGEFPRSQRAKNPSFPQASSQWVADFSQRFEFSLLLCALEAKLVLIDSLWPKVKGSLRLGFNMMQRNPADYDPVVPEAPMGHVIGFQFQVKGQDAGGVHSGELTFFRYSGVGRELLRRLPELATADGRPGAHLLLTSGSSWAGKSSCYHVGVQVGALIEPHPDITARIVNESTMRIEFVDDGEGPIQVSGHGLDERLEMLRRMVTVLGANGDEAEGGGPLECALMDLPDGRDQILLLVSNHEEARLVADTLHNLGIRWKGRVLRLVSEDEDIEDGAGLGGGRYARVLRLGDIERLREYQADVLVAPLIAFGRGHGILNEYAEAAIGVVYFLTQPNPRPKDLSLVVNAVNDWIVRAQESGDFVEWMRGAVTVADGADVVRSKAWSEWHRALRQSTARGQLDDGQGHVTWDMLVLMWRVIECLVRGGVPARVVLVDSAFAPGYAATPVRPDTPESSLLHSMRRELLPYFSDKDTEAGAVSPHERFVARALYTPIWRMLDRCLAEQDDAAQSSRIHRNVPAPP